MRINRLRQLLEAERSRFFLWSPVGVMLGIAWYFSLADEPPVWAGGLALGISLAMLAAAWRYPWRIFVVPFFLIALGFAAAQFRAHVVATPLLGEEIRNRTVEGTIDEIEPVEQKEKLVISHLVIDGVAPEKTPLRVRVSFREANPGLHVGDRVRLTANLYPLPSPTMPGSYDFARHFYFRSIGGNGFAMRPAELIEAGSQSGAHVWLNSVRHAIGENMRKAMPGATGAVAAAMTVGETGPIPADIKSTLRDSGLAHMLAIAGLHLGIVTAIVFYNVRLLLTLYPPLALRLPVKKIAALFALASAFIYLMLAGGPIPAQRAFIMVAFLFMAVLLDRRGITLRTLAIAALIILLIFPESMFGASFEMSFAATLAIVSLYERFGRSLHHPSASWARRAWSHILGIVVTSLAATLATSPFVLYHFNRFALFGLLANMVVVPLATFVIMPGMVLALLLMPLGWQAVGYVPMGFGTEVMIAMARWVTSLPYASLHLPSPTDLGLAVSAFGLLWLCLISRKERVWGIGFIALGLATILPHVPVDVLVSDDAHQAMVRLPGGHYTALKGTGRSFTVQNWLRSEGEDELVPLKETAIACENGICTYQKNNRTLLFVKKTDGEAIDHACAQKSDVLVAWSYIHPGSCGGATLLIGRAELETYGAHALWLSQGGVRMARTREGQGKRLWQPVVKAEEDNDF